MSYNTSDRNDYRMFIITLKGEKLVTTGNKKRMDELIEGAILERETLSNDPRIEVRDSIGRVVDFLSSKGSLYA